MKSKIKKERRNFPPRADTVSPTPKSRLVDLTSDEEMDTDQPITTRNNFRDYPTPATSVDLPMGMVTPSIVESSDSPRKGLRALGSHTRELIEVVDGLHRIGVSNLIHELPQIVVCGDQSSGKSSLIEGLSLVKVPRSEGKCTACPLYITLLNTRNTGIQWKCKVSLEYKYMYDTSATSNGELGPWTRQVDEAKAFQDVEKHQDLEKVIFCAQKALLNPGKNIEDYVALARTLDYRGPGRAQIELEENEVKFSPNTIRVEIRGVDQPNLCFVDLPGIINNSEKREESYLVGVVKHLMKEYIASEHSLILLTHSLGEDMANSTAASIVHHAKADDRVIGVLTKPDALPTSREYKELRAILDGRKFALKHGYFICKQPSQIQLMDPTYTYERARREEMEFFNTTTWAQQFAEIRDQSDQPMRERYGTAQLQNALSDKLAELTWKRLPAIIDQVEKRTAEVDEELKSIQEPSNQNPVAVLADRLSKLSVDIKDYLEGTKDRNDFLEKWKRQTGLFERNIRRMQPRFKLNGPGETVPPEGINQTPSPSKTAPTTPTTPRQRNVEEMDIDDGVVITGSNRKRRLSGSRQSMTPRKVQVGTGQIPIRQGGANQEGARKEGIEFTLPEIQKLIDQVTMSRIPGAVDPRVMNKMITKAIEVWAQPCEDFLTATASLLEQQLAERVNQVFISYKQTAVYGRVKEILEGFAQRLVKDQQQILRGIHHLEMTQIWMSDASDQKRDRDFAFTKVLVPQRRQIRLYTFANERFPSLFEDPTEKSREIQKKMEELTPEFNRKTDQYGKELLVAAEVQGYITTAHKRFIDHVAMSILGNLFVKLGDGVPEILQNELGVHEADAEQRCRTLLAEDSSRERRRVALKIQKEKLGQAMDQLQRYKPKSLNGIAH